MKGLELARTYYEAYGKPMLEAEFSNKLDRIAVGLVGHGSECFGYDDEISKDHDFEPGFCIWLDEADERDFGFRLFRAYRKLPDEFMGVKIQDKSLFGSRCKGVHTIKDFYAFYTGTGDVPQTLDKWMAIPDFYLAEATNGEVFADPLGKFTAIREKLKHGRPEDVRLKKLASALFYMAQAGQYNYERCIRHGEYAAAATALSDFAKSTAEAVHLLNNAYSPYYKWLFRSMKALPILGELADELRLILSAPYEKERNITVIESISRAVAEELRKEELADRNGSYLEPYAYSVTNKIKDATLRNAPVML